MNKQEIERAIERLENLSRYAQILKDPSEFFHHMNGHTTELSLVLASFDIAELSKEIQEILTRQLTNGWIPVSERLPEEGINPHTKDFNCYECTADFGYGRVDVRHYKYGNGSWWHGAGDVSAYVTAWRERPEPYKPEPVSDALSVEGYRENMLKKFTRKE